LRSLFKLNHEHTKNYHQANCPPIRVNGHIVTPSDRPSRNTTPPPHDVIIVWPFLRGNSSQAITENTSQTFTE